MPNWPSLANDRTSNRNKYNPDGLQLYFYLQVETDSICIPIKSHVNELTDYAYMYGIMHMTNEKVIQLYWVSCSTGINIWSFPTNLVSVLASDISLGHNIYSYTKSYNGRQQKFMFRIWFSREFEYLCSRPRADEMFQEIMWTKPPTKRSLCWIGIQNIDYSVRDIRIQL